MWPYHLKELAMGVDLCQIEQLGNQIGLSGWLNQNFPSPCISQASHHNVLWFYLDFFFFQTFERICTHLLHYKIRLLVQLVLEVLWWYLYYIFLILNREFLCLKNILYNNFSNIRIFLEVFLGGASENWDGTEILRYALGISLNTYLNKSRCSM